MLPAERHRLILASVADGRVAGTDELAVLLSVSRETVRRDLKVLEQQGSLLRVHGGATARRHTVGPEPSYVDRAGHALEAKRAIGRRAAALVRPGMTVVIDVGTTALEVARALPEDYHGMVATCSLVAAVELAGRPGVDVVVSGGHLRTGDLALWGGVTQEFFENLNPDIAFLGSGGVDAGAGLTDFHLEEVATRRRILARATASYVLADSTKLGRVAAHRVCGLGEFEGLITDKRPETALQAALERSGGQLIVTS